MDKLKNTKGVSEEKMHNALELTFKYLCRPLNLKITCRLCHDVTRHVDVNKKYCDKFNTTFGLT